MPGRQKLPRFIILFFVILIGNSFRSESGANTDGPEHNSLMRQGTTNSADNQESSLHRKNRLSEIISTDAIDSRFDNQLKGAWMLKDGSGEQVLIFIDNYFTHTAYSLDSKKFRSTTGGKYITTNNNLTVNFEFSTADKEIVGTQKTFRWSIQVNKLTVDLNGTNSVYTRIDDGSGALAGNWQISGRMQGNKLNEMKPGARKTIKILSGSRFQWAAINTETKEFSGTGGGNYTFKDGKYTEKIEFFSRDSSRVGASLSFEGSVENKNWVHKGLSSRGENIHEIWSRAFITP